MSYPPIEPHYEEVKNMFKGVSAFPLTPLDECGPSLRPRVHEADFELQLLQLVEARVDSIAVLGSTGNYMYFTEAERKKIVEIARERTRDSHLIVGIGDLTTHGVLQHLEAAQEGGVDAVLLAPVGYQKLTPGEVIALYEAVCERSELPVVVYDNPATTGFEFDLATYQEVAQMDGVAAIKLPSTQHLSQLRELPEIALGISGDFQAGQGLLDGCDVWFSVLAGTLPAFGVELTRAAQAGDAAKVAELNQLAQPLWELFETHGSLRVVAEIGEHTGITTHCALPAPLQRLSPEVRTKIQAAAAPLIEKEPRPNAL